MVFNDSLRKIRILIRIPKYSKGKRQLKVKTTIKEVNGNDTQDYPRLKIQK